jgi:hypothetical protein
MKYYFLGIIFLFHISIIAEENPFQIEEDFQAIDRADDSLFSTMKNELIKAEVVPESVLIDFKKRTIIKKEVKSIIHPPLHKKNIHKKINNRKRIEKKVKLLHKKSVYKNREKRRKLKLLKKQERLRKYYERNIANIDLVKEKQMKKEKLNRDYHKAVKDVDTF